MTIYTILKMLRKRSMQDSDSRKKTASPIIGAHTLTYVERIHNVRTSKPTLLQHLPRNYSSSLGSSDLIEFINY